MFCVILQVCDRKAMVDKYVAAVIKKEVQFSNDTYRTDRQDHN